MKLKFLHIQNFRSIVDLQMNMRDFTTLIGPNNSGKSAVLRAIEVFLNQMTPEINEFRKSHGDGEFCKEFIIEGHFDEIQEWERRTPGVAGIIYNNEIRLRLIAKNDASGKITTCYEAFLVEENIVGWESTWGELSQDIKKIATELGIDGRTWRTSANKERVKQVIRERNPEIISQGEENWTSENISIAPALKQAIPQAVLVPAVRDATDDAKPQTKTPFGTLISKIIMPAIRESGEYQSLIDSVDDLVRIISGIGGEQLEGIRVLADQLSERISSIIETRVVVTLAPPDTEKFLGSSATIHLDDGTLTPIYLQGHGAQRALIFAFIEFLAKESAVVANDDAEQRQRSTILLFEEPELYMHPHIMRRLKTALQNISESEDWQVIISTHSPFLIDVATDPQSLLIFKRISPETPPTFTQLSSDPFEEDDLSRNDRVALRAAIDFHPSVNEVFFAQQVVLVEGDTEVAVLCHEPELLSLVGIPDEKIGCTTVISCGGKWTIPPLAKLLARFEIPFRVIHDQDRKGKTDEELEELLPVHPYRANSRIEDVSNGADIYIVDDTFENILWGDGSIPTSDKPFRAWQKVRQICADAENLDEYPQLRDFVRFAYDWDFNPQA